MKITDRIRALLTRRGAESREARAAFARGREAKRVTARLVRQTDSLTKKDIAVWRQAWQRAISADSPSRALLYDIYTDCTADLHLAGCVGQRKGETMRKRPVLCGRDGKEDPEATLLLEAGWFSDFVSLALDSRFWGHSLIQLNAPEEGRSGLRYSSVELVPRKHVHPEAGTVTVYPGDDPAAGVPYREGELAEWCVEAGKPDDLGLFLKCAPACISKKNMLAYWDMFGEIFGIPMRIARTATSDTAERARIEKSLDDMGAAFWGLFSADTDIEIKESSRGDAYNVYDKRVERCNSEISKGVLMQTMTIDSGSSLSQSETHLEVFENVVREDARMIEGLVNDSLLPRMERHGFPVRGLVFKWDETAGMTPAERREEERMLLERFEIDPQYFIDRYNIPVTGPREAGGSAADGGPDDSPDDKKPGGGKADRRPDGDKEPEPDDFFA